MAYQKQAPWFFGMGVRRQLEEELVGKWYPETWPKGAGEASAGTSDPPVSDSNSVVGIGKLDGTGLRGKDAHHLALLFGVFVFGAMTNPESVQ